MVPNSLDDMLALLPHLPRRDLALMRSAIDKLMGAPAGTASPLYEAILTVARAKLPFSRFKASVGHKHWAENEKLVLGFVSDTWGELDRVVFTALLVYLLEMLADDLRRRNITPSVTTLALNLPTVPEAFDRNFPGYREDGLSSMILQSMVHK